MYKNKVTEFLYDIANYNGPTDQPTNRRTGEIIGRLFFQSKISEFREKSVKLTFKIIIAKK